MMLTLWRLRYPILALLLATVFNLWMRSHSRQIQEDTRQEVAIEQKAKVEEVRDAKADNRRDAVDGDIRDKLRDPSAIFLFGDDPARADDVQPGAEE